MKNNSVIRQLNDLLFGNKRYTDRSIQETAKKTETGDIADVLGYAITAGRPNKDLGIMIADGKAGKLKNSSTTITELTNSITQSITNSYISYFNEQIKTFNYKVLITQDKEDNPEGKPYENTIGHHTWIRRDIGQYACLFIDPVKNLQKGNTVIPLHLRNYVDTAGRNFRLEWRDTNEIVLETLDGGEYTDGLLDNFPIEFYVLK